MDKGTVALAALVAAFRETLENFREWREEHARYFEALRPIRSQLDKELQERDRLRAEGRQAEVQTSFEESVARMEQAAGPDPGFPPPLKGLEREAMRQLKWWDAYSPKDPAEMDQRYKALRTLSDILAFMRDGIHGKWPHPLPWDVVQPVEVPGKLYRGKGPQSALLALREAGFSEAVAAHVLVNVMHLGKIEAGKAIRQDGGEDRDHKFYTRYIDTLLVEAGEVNISIVG